jgi:hypothetical protein
MAKRPFGRRRLPVPGSVERALDTALDKVLAVERPAVLAYVSRVRRKHPLASPAEVIEQLERRYVGAVVGVGAASGGAAALPGTGTAASVASGAAEIAAFVSATGLFVLALAEVHGLPVTDPQLRRALVLTVLLGDLGAAAVAGAELEPKDWAQVLGRSTSKDKIRGINSRLGHLLVTRFGARQGALLAGRALPFGIGAGVGAVGNAALARRAITASRRVFGPPPDRFPDRVLDADPATSERAVTRFVKPGRPRP